MRYLLKTLLCFMTIILSVSSCTEYDDYDQMPKPSDKNSIVGSWYADITGKTYSIWNYGPALSSMTFYSDGTGTTDVYYILNDNPIARENHTFTYNINNGKLTMVLDDETREYTYQIAKDQLILDNNDNSFTYSRPNAEQLAQFEKWDNQDLEEVPAPARYTVFVYGNAGGRMDIVIEEGFWKIIQPLLKDGDNVRVVCLYKYGQNTTSTMTDDGDVVWFELNSETDLSNLHSEGLNIRGMNAEAMALKLYSPNTLHLFMELSSLVCPAKDYIFAIWGHGSGFDPGKDIPGKYADNPDFTRGVIGDEWNNNEQLDMYELSQAIEATGRSPLKAIFFHNCLMGNIETLTELRDVTEYIACSSHILTSSGEVLSAFVKGLMDNSNVEDAFSQMFHDITPIWQNSYKLDEEGYYNNGDFKLIRAKALDGIISVCQRLATRLVELYPEDPEPINRAICQVYRFYTASSEPGLSYVCPFFDLADFAHKLAEETGDAEFASIAESMDKAFSDAILQYADVSWNEQHLSHYTLSICLYHQAYYEYDFIGKAGYNWKANIVEGYEQSTFHKLTGWGNFLRLNKQVPLGNPTSDGGGPLK